jgi:cytochrome c oxidase subunit 4
VDLPLPAPLPDFVNETDMEPTQTDPAAVNSGTEHSAGHSDLGHVVPVWLLAAVFAALIALTGVTVAAAQIDLGNLNLYLALAIAAVKASLVVMFFMHLYWDRPFNSMVFVGCLLFVTLFIGFTLTDSKANESSDIRGQGKDMSGIHTPLGSPAK